jgi:WD40 repeat protein
MLLSIIFSGAILRLLWIFCLITLSLGNLVFADSNFCRDLFLTNEELRKAVRALVELQVSFSQNPIFQNDNSYKLSSLSKFNTEMNNLSSLDKENAFLIYQEEMKKYLAEQRQRFNLNKDKVETKKREISILKNADKTLIKQSYAIATMQISKNFRFMTTGSHLLDENIIKVTDLNESKTLYEVLGDSALMSSNEKFLVVLGYYNDAKSLSVNVNSVIKVLDLISGRQLYQLKVPNEFVRPRITADNQFLILELFNENDRRIGFKVYDLSSGELKYKSSGLNILAAIANMSNSVSTTQRKEANSIKIYDLTTRINTPLTQSTAVKSQNSKYTIPKPFNFEYAEFTSDDRFFVSHLSSDFDRIIKIVDLHLNTDIANIKLQAGELKFKIDSTNNRIVTMIDSRKVKVFELSSGLHLFEKEFDEDKKIVQSVFNNDYLIFHVRDKSAPTMTYSTQVFDFHNGNHTFEINDHNQTQVTSMALSSDDKLLALGYGSGTVQVFDLQSKSKQFEQSTHSDFISRLFFGSDWHLYSASLDGTAKLTNLNAFIKHQ